MGGGWIKPKSLIIFVSAPFSNCIYCHFLTCPSEYLLKELPSQRALNRQGTVFPCLSPCSLVTQQGARDPNQAHLIFRNLELIVRNAFYFFFPCLFVWRETLRLMGWFSAKKSKEEIKEGKRIKKQIKTRKQRQLMVRPGLLQDREGEGKGKRESGMGGLHLCFSLCFQTRGDLPLCTNQGSIETFLFPFSKL